MKTESGPVEVRAIHPSEIESARHLLVAAGWDRRVADPDEFRLLLSRSQVALVAVDRGVVVGFLRALTDGLSNGYISTRLMHTLNQGSQVTP